MTVIAFNVKPHIQLQPTEAGIAQGVPGLSAYEVAVANGFEGTEEEWLVSLIISVGSGAKASATDAGTFGQLSLTDDYLYICVQTGTAGNAIWKKTVLFAT